MANRTHRIDPSHLNKIVGMVPMGRDPASVRRRVVAMEQLLEGLFVIPVINRRVGLDVLLDLLPFAGGAAASVMGSWVIWEARNIGMSRTQMARMAGNVGIDFLLGLIPWVGAIPDFFFRSNTRNVKMIKRHLDKHYPASATVDLAATPPAKF